MSRFVFFLALFFLILNVAAQNHKKDGYSSTSSSSLPYDHPEFPSKVVHSLRLLKQKIGEVNHKEAHARMFHRDDTERILVSLVHTLLDQEERTSLNFAIKSLGGVVEAESDRRTDCFLSLDILDTLAERLEIQDIHAEPPPLYMTGSVETQQVGSLNLPYLSKTGAGIKVGVISDSVNVFGGGLDDSISTLDLPPISRHTILQDRTTGTDEGRAMAEIIYDIAPGVDFLYYMPTTNLDMANGISALVTAGADVIVDDIRFLLEPVYQNGPIAQAANSARENNVVYVTSAGNQANTSYEAVFDSTVSTITFDFGDHTSSHYCHKFTEASGTGRLDISGGTASKQFSLQWKCPYYSVGGQSCGVDLDIIIADWSTNPPAASSASSGQDTRVDPWEYVSFTASATSSLSICLKANTAPSAANFNGSPVLMKLVFWSGGLPSVLPGSPTILGQANAEGALAVGALYYWQTCRGEYTNQNGCGTTLPKPTEFTSLGGQTVWFNDDGTLKVSPVTLQKPDVTAAQCGDTSFFGSNIDGNSYPNFCGTSASAPAVAAVAALMLEGCTSLTADDVVSYLISTATNVFPVGFDYSAGHGQVDGEAAIAARPCLLESPSSTLSLNPSTSRAASNTPITSQTRSSSRVASSSASKSRSSPLVTPTGSKSRSLSASRSRTSPSRTNSRSGSGSRSRSRSKSATKTRSRTSPSRTRTRTRSKSRTSPSKTATRSR